MTTTNPALNGWSDIGSKRPPAGPNYVAQTFYDLTAGLLSICTETSPGVFQWVPVSTGSAAGGGSTQTDWSVNASTGNDNAVGNSAAPLATIAAWRQRLLANPLAQNLGIVTLSIVGNTNLNDPLDERGITPFGGTQVNVVGTPVSILSNQIITAVTAKNAAAGTNVACSITVAGLPVSWTSSGILGVLCVITSAGPRLGATFVAVKDLGGKAARISDMESDATSVFPYNPFGYTFATPQVNDTFTAYSLPVIDSVIIDPPQTAPMANDNAQIRWLHRQIRTSAQPQNLSSPGVFVVWQGCSLPAPQCKNEIYSTSFFRTALWVFAGFNLTMIGGAALSGAFVELLGGGMFFPNNILIQAPASNGMSNNGGYIEPFGDIGIFDGPGGGYQGQTGSYLDMESSSEHVYGSGHVSFGMLLFGGTFTSQAASRVLTGAAGDLDVSNVAKTWAQTPYYDSTTASGAFNPTTTNRAQGTFTFNGATPVTVAIPSIQASDSVIIQMTSATGTLGAWAITAQTPGTGITVVSVAGNNNTASYTLKKG